MGEAPDELAADASRNKRSITQFRLLILES